MHAAIMVGRDVTPWLAAVPQLARQELLSRCTPLCAYLRRARTGGSSRAPRYGLVPNEVYRRGTERTAKGAFSYRVGMTMAEWLCWGYLGLSHSVHAEEAVPPYTDPDKWDSLRQKPDLLGRHGLHPSSWIVEAKAERRLSKATHHKGVAQLDLDSLVEGPHRRVLCCTSIEEQVFMTLSIDTRSWPGSDPAEPVDPDPLGGPDPASDDEALYNLARSSMLIYLALRSNSQQAEIVPVGAQVDRRRSERRAGTAHRGNVILLETDESTQELRHGLRSGRTPTAIPAEAGIDMLTTTVPGTGLTVGLSGRIFTACEALISAEDELTERAEDMAEVVYTERATSIRPQGDMESLRNDAPEHLEFTAISAVPPRWNRVDSEERDWWRVYSYRRLERQHRIELMAATRRGFELGREATWLQRTDWQPRVAVDGPPGQLESATADTYLAVDPATLT